MATKFVHRASLAKKQDWFNESTQNCITVRFNNKKVITEVLPNPKTAKCQKGLDASRKVWEKYHDGQAPVNTIKLNDERKILADNGFQVSYWIDEISPGRSSEYWLNETTQKTMYIVWEIQGNKWVKTEKTDYKYGENPAPPKEYKCKTTSYFNIMGLKCKTPGLCY